SMVEGDPGRHGKLTGSHEMTPKKDQHLPGADLGVTAGASGAANWTGDSHFKSADVPIDAMVAEINGRHRPTGRLDGSIDIIGQQGSSPSNGNSTIERGVGGDDRLAVTRTHGTVDYPQQRPPEHGLVDSIRAPLATRVASPSKSSKASADKDGVA